LGEKNFDQDMLEKSIATKEFNKAFKFIQEKANQANNEDDQVDDNLNKMLLNLLENTKV